MKSLIIILFSIINLTAQIYVSPTGSDSNTGTLLSPFRSLTKAITKAGADSTIYMRGGVYNDSLTIRLNKNGLAGKPIKIWAYPGEKPVIDFSTQAVSTSSRGLLMSNNYWYIKGITIRNAKDNGINISGKYNVIENCTIYYCEDTGLQISGGGSYNLVLNCDSYLNYDPLTYGENADGFAPKLDIGPGNVFRGCRAWGNSDDGWDMYESDDTVVIENCLAFRNGFNIWGISNFQGDGNGFKLGGNYIAGPHVIKNSVAFDNKGKGFDQNNNIAGITVYNNSAWRNELSNFAFGSTPTTGAHDMRNNLSLGGGVQLAGNTVQFNNSWNGFVAASTDFLSLDTSIAFTERDSAGNLAVSNFMRLAPGSQFIDAGIIIAGIPYNGTAPDLGAYETGSVSNITNDNSQVYSFSLEQNYPNPFNPDTKFRFNISIPGNVEIDIYDVIGNKVANVVNKYYNSGEHELSWKASDKSGKELSSGTYIARMNFENKIITKKILLLK